MLLLVLTAKQPTPLEKLKQVPPEFWMKLAAVIVAVVIVVIILRKLAQANKIVLAVVALIVVSAVGLNWIYERNEPKWATPVVEKLAQFFPTKGAYAAKPAPDPSKH
jgi:hypothetical protein